jgi:hypothetical protein
MFELFMAANMRHLTPAILQQNSNQLAAAQ